VRAGPRLAANLRRAAQGLRPRPWRPQAEALAIVGLGHGRAVAWRRGLAVSGRWVAWYKDWIDARFLRRYAQPGLPRRPALAEPTPVGLDPADLAVLSGPTAAAGQAEAPDPAGTALVQQATHLPDLLNDPYSLGRIAAAHALARMHAADVDPWTAVAIATPPAAPPAAARADVLLLLQGAAEVLAADGAELVECATTASGAPALGLVLTGYPTPAHGPAAAPRAGDALILTKPLGSGIVLEGYRRGLAEARWLLGGLQAMTASSTAAASLLRQHGAAACAAVAEHGLVGTLVALLRDANLAAALDPNAVLALPGARELAHLGVERQAATENRRAWPDPPDWPDLALLTDPQIAGGLLACVPQAHAEACLAALHAAGYPAARIGQAETRRLDTPRLRLEPRSGSDSEGAP
jgi:selenide,water dikinase